MKIYAIIVCTFSSDMYSESYTDSYWKTKELAEDHIIKANLYEKSDDNNVHIQEIQVRE